MGLSARRTHDTAHVPHQSSTGEAGAASQLRRERRALYQPSATAVTSSPREAAELLERRRREARARLKVREQVRRWEQWRRWAWCRGSCSAAVLHAGARGMLARRRKWAAQAGTGDGWTFVAGWGDGLVPLGGDWETNIAELETTTYGAAASIHTEASMCLEGGTRAMSEA